MKNLRNYFSNPFIAIASAVLILLLLLSLLFYFVFRLKNRAVEESYATAALVSKDIKHSVELTFRSAFLLNDLYTGNLLVYRSNMIPRPTVYTLVKGTLRQKRQVLALWSMWERDAFDKKDSYYASDSMHDEWGSFAFAFYYKDDSILFEKNDTLDYLEDFYTIPARLRKPVLLDPFHYQYHGNPKNYFETSLVNPVYENNKLLGVIGTDLDLDSLQLKFGTIKTHASGFVSILSNSGKIVTHPDTSCIDTYLAGSAMNRKSDLADSLQRGTEFTQVGISEFTGMKVIRYFYPINMEYMEAPWYIMVEIPENEILASTASYTFVSYIIFFILILLLVYLIANVLISRSRQSRTMEALKLAEASEAKLIRAQEVLRDNEQILDAIFNQARNLIGLLNKDGTLIRANQTALEMIKASGNEVYGKYFWDCPWWVHSAAEQQKLKEIIALAADGNIGTLETTHLDEQGKIHYILFSIKPVYNAMGEVRFLLPEGVDISSLKKVELLLLEGEEKYKAIFNNANDAIFLLNNGLFVDCNEKALKLFNCSREDIIGISPARFSPETQASGQLTSTLIEEKLQLTYTQGPQSFEWQHCTLDGRTFDADLHLTRVRIQDSDLILAIVRDISVQKAYEETLRKSRERLRASLQNTPNVAIQWYTLSGEVLFWNQASQSIFGYTSEEALGMTLDKMIFTRAQHDDFLRLLHLSNESHLPQGPYESAIRTKHGEERIILTTTFTIPGEENENVFVCMDIDITEQKRIESAMKESEERYRTLVEAFPDFIMVSDMDGNIVFNNEKFAIHDSDHIALSSTSAIKELIHPDDYAITNELVEKLLASDSAHTSPLEFRIHQGENEFHWYSGIFSRINFQGKKSLQLVLRDIHDKKLAEQELDMYRNQLELLVKDRTDELEAINEELRATNDDVYQMNEDLEAQKNKLEAALSKLHEAQNHLVQSEKLASLGVFTAGIAHEINNPVNFISNGSQALFLLLEELKSEIQSDKPVNMKLFDDIHSSRMAIETGIERTSAIISSLRNYAHTGEEKYVLYNSIYCIKDALILLKNSYKYHINIVENFPDSIEMECIPGKINQVFVNLISNAVQSIGRAGEISIGAKTQGSFAVFSVHDNGTGIAKANIPKIFDPFFTTKDVGKGTGLGLYIVHGIIEQHQGKIEVLSEPGKGTKFTLHIPLRHSKK